MFDAIIAFSLRQRALILLLTLALVVGGIVAFSRLPIDAVPDITNNQVQVLTSAPALSSPEVEHYVTFPIEVALKSLPDLVELRSLSRSGLSVVTVVFADNVDIYFARQQVLEKLREAEEQMPAGVERPELGPVSTGLGEIFRYVIRDTTGRLSPMDLRSVQDWIVRRGLLGTPGLAEVNSLGGYVKQYHILVDPDAMAGHGLTLRDVFDAVARTSGNAGGAYIETGPEQLSVRSVGLATSVDDLRSTVIRSTPNGTPVTLAQVASIETGSAIRFGSASQDGRGEVVTGITMQLKGANARVTVGAVKERIDRIRPSLPKGVVIEPYYDREVLVDRTIATVIRNLVEGALLVIGVLLLLLVNLRAGVILASVIPLAMMFAGIMMVLTGQSGNLMSLGAIDFGLVVDGSLIIVENVLRLLEERFRGGEGVRLTDRQMRDLVFGGSVEVRKAAQFGEIIIIVVYLPILTLQGIEGKLFRPMALTVVFALVGALLLSVTYVPTMLSLFLKKSGRIRHSPVIEWMRRLYEPALERALGLRIPIVAVTALLLVGSVIAFTRMGGEFIPRLDEGDIAMHIIRLPSISLTESQKITTRVERALMTFQEVRTVVTSTGRAEISTDPMGVELADAFVMLKPVDEWTSGRTKAELVAAMERKLADIPGAGVQFLQPIEMRTNELIAGARGDVVIKVIGDDFDVMNPAAEKITSILRATSGSADVTMEQTTGLPQLMVRPDRATIARYGMTVEDVNDIVGTAIAGRKATELAEGERRVDVVVRFPEGGRNSVEAVRGMMVTTPNGQRVPLSELASVTVEDGPAQISREDGTRFVTVQANVRGRDIESFVEEVRARVTREVRLPAGYNVIYGGQFENLEAASRRLLIVVPIALALIFLLLFQTFRSIRLGVMIFLCVPMAVIGGVVALLIGGMPFSISAGVGFIALFGIAVLNGIVMVAAIRKHQGHGLDRRASVRAGAHERLRPVLTTAALAGFGFVPMLLAHGAGAEVQRPLAAVIIGGLISSTFLTLFVLPIVYDWLGGNYVPPSEEEEADPERTLPGDKPEPRMADAAETSGGGGRTGAALAVVALALLFGQRLDAQTVLTREQMRERALASAPATRAADAAISRRRAERASGSILPNLDLIGAADEASSPALTGRPNARLGVSQTFALPGLYAARGRVNDLLIEQAGGEREAVVGEIRRRADLAYVELVATRWRAALADSAVAIADEFSRLAARRRELGEAPALEALQASIALTDARRRRSEARIELSAAQAEARTLIGAEPDEVIVAADTLSYRPVTVDVAEIERRARESSPLLAAARIEVEASRAREQLVAAERLPEVTLEYSLQTVEGVGGYYGGALRLGLPLWRWMSSGPDDAARAETAMREAVYARLERELLSAVREAHARHASTSQLVDNYREELIPQANQAYQIARRLFDEGEATYLEVLTAQSAMVTIHAGYVDAVLSAERSLVELESLLGGDPR